MYHVKSYFESDYNLVTADINEAQVKGLSRLWIFWQIVDWEKCLCYVWHHGWWGAKLEGGYGYFWTKGRTIFKQIYFPRASQPKSSKVLHSVPDIAACEKQQSGAHLCPCQDTGRLRLHGRATAVKTHHGVTKVGHNKVSEYDLLSRHSPK